MQAHFGCRYTCTYACMGRTEETSAVIPQTPFIYWPRINQVEWIDWPVSPRGLPFSIPSPQTLKEHTIMPRFFLIFLYLKFLYTSFDYVFPLPIPPRSSPPPYLPSIMSFLSLFLNGFQGSNSRYYILSASTLLTKLFSLPHHCFLIS